jgi:ABC-type glycerol-3-phosphate transport system substrate-binding protein
MGGRVPGDVSQRVWPARGDRGAPGGRRRVLWAAPAAGAALAALAACGQAGGGGAQPAADPPLALEFWHNKAQPEGQDVTTIVTRYNATFAPTRVTEIFQGNGATLLTKLKAALAGATPPDVTYGFGAWMPSFAEQGALVPAEDQIKRLGGVKKEDFFPTLISAQTWKGKLQALPYGTGSKGYYVRPEIVRRENVARLPLTWEEFDGFAARVTRDEQYALGMSATDASWFQLLLGQRGGKVLEAPNGKAAFHQQPGIDALAQLTDLAQRKRTLKITSTAAGDFANGQLASLMSGEWQIRFYRADGTPHDTGFFPRQKASDPPSTLLGVDGFYMFKTTPERQDTTWRFATWLLKPEVYHSWAVAGSFRLPVMPAAVKSEEYQKFLKENPQQKPFADQLPGAFVTPPTVLGDELSTAIGNAVRRAVTGEQAPRDSLATAAREFDALVK